jgi:hypothetical protein
VFVCSYLSTLLSNENGMIFVLNTATIFCTSSLHKSLSIQFRSFRESSTNALINTSGQTCSFSKILNSRLHISCKTTVLFPACVAFACLGTLAVRSFSSGALLVNSMLMSIFKYKLVGYLAKQPFRLRNNYIDELWLVEKDSRSLMKHIRQRKQIVQIDLFGQILLDQVYNGDHEIEQNRLEARAYYLWN